MEVGKFTRKLVQFGILGLVLVCLNGEIIHAQRSEQSDGSIDLLSLGCSSSGDGELLTDITKDISVGKQIFTPVFYFGKLVSGRNPYLLTCKNDLSGRSTTLQLIFGIKDYAIKYRHEVTVIVYLDGQSTASQTLTAGEGKTLLLDVTKTSSIALEAICSFHEQGRNRRCPALAVLKASILPSPSSSLINSNSAAFNNSENLDILNSTGKTVNSSLEESSWGNSTIGKEEKEASNTNSSNNSNINDTIETINTIIDIIK